MSERETTDREHPADDEDVEIVSLPDHPVGTRFIQPMSSWPARPSLAPRFTPRQRRMQLIITIGVVILALAIVFASSPGVRGLIIPKPTPTLVPGVNLFYFQLQPAWGKVAIDGRALVRLPVIGKDAPVQLAVGRHLLQWIAPPFVTQSCTVSVPPTQSDTCSYNASQMLSDGLSAWIVRFTATLAMLPGGQSAALIRVAQTALDAQSTTTTVQPGEVYGVQSQKESYSIAATPLRATLRFVLDANPNSPGSCIISGRDTGQGCFYVGQDCRLFCSDPPQSVNPGLPAAGTLTSPSGSTWNVLAAIYPTWNYTTLAGRKVAVAQSDDVSEGERDEDEFLEPMSISWSDSAWRVTAPISDTNRFENPICGTAQDETQSETLLGRQFPPNLSIQWYDVDEPLYAAGCVALLVLIQAHPKTLPPSTYTVTLAYFLHRFGILLAANSVAHRLAPSLPVASAADQQIAVQIVARSKVLQGLG